MNRILDIFYNQIIKEACLGRINCFLYFNMPFSTYIQDTNEKYKCEFPASNELLIPTLIIKNKQLFDELLIEYTNLALSFYPDTNCPEEILVPNVLIERWNAKSMAIMIKAKQKNLSLLEIKEELDKQNSIWININEKLNRTFRRLEYHHDSINITSEPFLMDSYIHVKISDYIKCNNPLLLDTFNVVEQTTKSDLK